MLGSIGAVVYFSISIGLANSANEYARLSRLGTHPLTMPAQATAVSYSKTLIKFLQAQLIYHHHNNNV